MEHSHNAIKVDFLVLLRCHFFQGRSVSVGVSMKKLVFGSVSVFFFKASCTANPTNVVPHGTIRYQRSIIG